MSIDLTQHRIRPAVMFQALDQATQHYAISLLPAMKGEEHEDLVVAETVVENFTEILRRELRGLILDHEEAESQKPEGT